jgi:hypothetical protein
MAELAMGGQIVALIAMIAVSLWGRQHIDAETRIRARAGTTGIDWTMGKNTALFLTPFIGVLIVIATLAVGDSENRETISALGFVVMVIFLAAHLSSVRRAAG